MEQSDLLHYLCVHLNRIEIRYFITGSQATIAFGEPRFTNDIDVVVDLNLNNCDAFCNGFPSDDYYLNRDTVRQEISRQGMFNIIHPASGLKIDVVIPSQGNIDEQRFNRSISFQIAEDCLASFSSPEDIIAQKLLWHQMGGGERHLRDIAGILKIRNEKIDRDYIGRQVLKLGVADLWQELLGKLNQQTDD